MILKHPNTFALHFVVSAFRVVVNMYRSRRFRVDHPYPAARGRWEGNQHQKRRKTPKRYTTNPPARDYKLMPNTKARARPTVEDRATMFTPATAPAFSPSPVEFEPPEPPESSESSESSESELLSCSLTGT